jgi:hypothetical protein
LPNSGSRSSNRIRAGALLPATSKTLDSAALSRSSSEKSRPKADISRMGGHDSDHARLRVAWRPVEEVAVPEGQALTPELALAPEEGLEVVANEAGEIGTEHDPVPVVAMGQQRRSRRHLGRLC